MTKIMIQKTILEYIFRNRTFTKYFGYIATIVWSIGLFLTWFLLPEPFSISLLFINQGLMVLLFITIFLVFKIPEFIDEFLRSQNLDSKHINEMLSEVYTLRTTKYGKQGKIINSPLFRNSGRIITLFLLVGLCLIVVILGSSSNMTPAETILSWFDIVGWSLFLIFIVDFMLVMLYALLLPREIVERKLKEPEIYHPDQNFGYLIYGNFSFKIYIFGLIFSIIFLILYNIGNMLTMSHQDFTYQYNLFMFIIWAIINLLLMALFYWSIHFYKKVNKSAKVTETEKVQKMINKIIADKNENDYFKLAGLMDLRFKIEHLKKVPISSLIVKKLIISLITSIILTQVLPIIFKVLSL